MEKIVFSQDLNCLLCRLKFFLLLKIKMELYNVIIVFLKKLCSSNLRLYGNMKIYRKHHMLLQ